MAKVFAFPMAPANYTLDIIENVYKPMGINYAFVYGSSEASNRTVGTTLVLDSIKNPLRRIKIIYQILRDNDAFIINSYTDWISLQILLINMLSTRKPMGISSDTQLSIPVGRLRTLVKTILLRWMFSRPYIYGLPGGTKTHVQLFTHFGMDDSRVFVLPMMVDNCKYRQNEIPYPGKIFTFIYIGRLVPCKQVDKVIEAFKDLQCNGIETELHIVGDGTERERLHKIAKGSNVIFHGKLYGESLVAELHKANCLVLYSSRESWGLVVNEALASGIPCIVSDAVGARFDLVEGDNPTGVVVPCDDINALSSAMQRLLSSASLWSEFSKNAVKRMMYWNYDLYRAQLSSYVENVTC